MNGNRNFKLTQVEIFFSFLYLFLSLLSRVFDSHVYQRKTTTTTETNIIEMNTKDTIFFDTVLSPCSRITTTRATGNDRLKYRKAIGSDRTE